MLESSLRPHDTAPAKLPSVSETCQQDMSFLHVTHYLSINISESLRTSRTRNLTILT
ncbi:hypothetical protein BGZ63DRAFT_395447 [Mariannaea sp. PMI_226]|nr:hypothetical protein BGZ63DRAFT_395447 [Mariannaea sp. PMI_226]